MDKYIINYLGKQYTTTIKKELTDEEYNQVVEEYYTLPSIDDVINQIKKFHFNNGTKINYITNYYMKDLMAKTKIHYNNWTIEEVLNYKPIIEFFAGKSDKNKKVFPDTMTLEKKIETAFRLCGFKVASKPSNFPVKIADKIIREYNINNKIYDFSCGWGVRLLCSLRNGLDYYGTDPNYILDERLEALGNLYKSTCDISNIIKIYHQGSEEYIEELNNSIGLAFSSPPYYNLEDYKIGKQSYHEGVTYNEWKINYLIPTIKNVYNYLIPQGIFAINVNNFKKYNNYDLIQDTIDISKQIGFNLINTIPLKNITRCHGHKEWNEGDCGWYDNSENVFIFSKQQTEEKE